MSSLLAGVQCKFKYLIEEKGSAGGSGETCGDELCPVSQNDVTVGAREETTPPNVIQEDAPHFFQLVANKAALFS